MPKNNTTPHCRYNHGPLQQINAREGYPRAFGLVGINAPNITPKESSQTMLVLDVFECPTCGYTELFEHTTEL